MILSNVDKPGVKSKRIPKHREPGGNDVSKKSFCWRKFLEFCKRTDLHGYKYIAMEDLNIAERSCWALAVAISIACTAFFIVTAYRWYARNPIVTVIESTQSPIWDVPFPAVTICDLNLVSRMGAREFTNNLTLPANITRDYIFDTLKLVPLLHSTYTADPEQKQRLYQLQAVLDLNNISIETLFKKLSPASSCNQLVERCMWKNAIYRCDQLFQQVFTLFSLCCTFNYHAVDTADKTNIEGEEWLHLSTPRRVTSCGYQTALTVMLRTDPDDYYSASIGSQGVLVLIDNAYNMPYMDSPVRMVNPSTEMLIALSPQRTYTTAGVKTFLPEQRQCYYNDEFKNEFCKDTTDKQEDCVVGRVPVVPFRCGTLKANIFEAHCLNLRIKIGDFRQYSFHNCMAYQKALVIINDCDCVPFFFPLKDDHRTCNFKDLDCLEIVLGPDHNGNDKPYHDTFQCLPECEHYDYSLEVALGKLGNDLKIRHLPFNNIVSVENRSLLNVFFNDLVSTRYRRDVHYNWQNIVVAMPWNGKWYGLRTVDTEFVGSKPVPEHTQDNGIDKHCLLSLASMVKEHIVRKPTYLRIFCNNSEAAFGGLLSLMLGFTLTSGFDVIVFILLRVVFVTNKKNTNNKVNTRGQPIRHAWRDVAITHSNVNLKKLDKQTHNPQYRY